ncbi:MAG: glycosyltransferase [Saccharofermentans sp.]|nr:glycosyltransferase [Saccharofermentans sp.]
MYKYNISVIIPVYNASRFLKECIDSVFVQTISDYEVIFVDDGSTDDSLEIIYRETAQYTNVKVIHQENKGVGFARSVGLKNAEGKYIGWVDSDDFIAPEMFEKLFLLAEQEGADYTYCDYEYYPKQVSTKSKWFKEYKGVIDGDFIDRNTQCWNTLVKKDLYDRVGIEDLLLKLGEYSWIAAMINANKVEFTREKLYYYRVGHDSLSGGNLYGRVPYYKKCVQLSKDLKIIIKGTQFEDKLDSYFDYRYIYTLLLLMIVSAKNSDKKTYVDTKNELIRVDYRHNPYLDHFIADNYGSFKSWVVTRVLPVNFSLARFIVNCAM